jgi:hypothetical protein
MPKVLDAQPITTAVTGVTSAVVGSGSGAPGGLLIDIDFVYGSGGTSGKVWVQTSLDGSSWVDIANMTFTTASKRRLMNLSADTPVTTPYTATDGTLADDTVKDGLIGAIYRAKYTTVGTYGGGTTLSVTILPGS